MHKNSFTYNFHNFSGDFEIRVTTLAGIEDLLAEEMLQLGGRNIQKFSRGVSLTGDKGFLYKIHLMSSLAIKALIPLVEFNCTDEKDFYRALYQFDWENWLNPDQTFLFECVGEAKWLNNRMFGSVRAKDALSDHMRSVCGKRPSVDKMAPDRYFYLHIQAHKTTLFLNATGEVLHRRGYRKQQGTAPLSELLAAALVRMARPENSMCVVDAMCGSATLGIEAGLHALHIPPGIFREEHAFMHFPDFDEILWNKIVESKTSKIKEPEGLRIYAFDTDDMALKHASANVRAAKMEDLIRIEKKDFFKIEPPAITGMIFMNPPYGKRLDDGNFELFSRLGQRLKHFWKGWQAWMIFPESAYDAIGLRHKKRARILNGNIPCYLCGYELY